jgi:hypothetical protein
VDSKEEAFDFFGNATRMRSANPVNLSLCGACRDFVDFENPKGLLKSTESEKGKGGSLTAVVSVECVVYSDGDLPPKT